MKTSKITFDQLPHMVSGLSEKLDRVLDLLEMAGVASHSKQSKPSRRLVYAKEACQIIGKSLSTLYRAVKAPNDPIPSYKRSKLLYFYEAEIYAWIEGGRKHSMAPTLSETTAAVTAGMKHRPRGAITYNTNWLIVELRQFTNYLMQLCPKHHIQHLALAFSYDSCFVKEADVT